MKKIVLAAMLALFSLTVAAKLPPPSDEAKAKAAEAKAKTEWSNKVAAYQLCRSQDATVNIYLAAMKAQGKEAKHGAPGTPCSDPGPFVAAAATATAGGATTAPIAAPSDAKPAAEPAKVQSSVKKP